MSEWITEGLLLASALLNGWQKFKDRRREAEIKKEKEIATRTESELAKISTGANTAWREASAKARLEWDLEQAKRKKGGGF